MATNTKVTDEGLVQSKTPGTPTFFCNVPVFVSSSISASVVLNNAADKGVSITEGAPSTNGNGVSNQPLFELKTLSGSTAEALNVLTQNTRSFHIQADGTVIVGDGTYTGEHGVAFSINKSNATAGGVNYELFNRSSATNSICQFLFQAANGIVSADFFVDGLGSSGFLTNAPYASVGTLTNHPFILYTNATARLTVSASGGLRAHAYGAGTLTTDALGNVTAASDERLKDIIGEYSAGLHEITALEPVLFHWKKETGLDPDGEYAGLIAQEVGRVLPHAIGEMNDDVKTKTLSDRVLVVALINAVKELNLTVKTLSDRVNALEEQRKP